MKKLIFFTVFLLGIIFSSCSSEDEPNSLSVPMNTVEFDYTGGEQQVNISYIGNWTYQCSEEWLTIRKNQNGLRIIAEENTNTEERIATICLYANNSLLTSITIEQQPFVGIEELNEISIPFSSSRYSIKHYYKVAPVIEISDDWCSADFGEDSIFINVRKNYELKSRRTHIKLTYNSNVREISVIQAECPWFESFQMIPVNAGTFYMGAQSNNQNSNNYDKDAFSVESPVHKVTLSDFSISAFEVTQEQWIASMGSNPSSSQLGGKYPVENVSWDDVQLFISNLCEASGKTYRLPTEAEWEYAAKGGEQLDELLYAGSNIPSTVGWFYSNSNSSIHEVGQKNPNALGIYDMTGNVSEWVSDWFTNYEDNDITNPIGPTYGELKINRGGSCNSASKNCRNTYRNMNPPSFKSSDLGFRLVLVQ